MSKKRLSSSDFSNPGETKTLDVADVPTELLEIQFYAQEIQRLSRDPEITALAQKIEQGLDPCISAMANAVDQLERLADVA